MSKFNLEEKEVYSSPRCLVRLMVMRQILCASPMDSSIAPFQEDDDELNI